MHTRMVWSSQLLVLALVFCATVSQTFGAQVNFRWCCKGKAEMDKCKKFKAALPMIAKAAGVDHEIIPACVDGPETKDCTGKISNGEADLITLDGGDVYTAGKAYGLVPVVYENYGSGTGKTYTAVAVAKANTSLNLGNLKGKKSCHTGYEKTAGYNVPVGYLLEEGTMERKGCGKMGTAKSVSMFFSKSCIPGSPKEFPNLCELCPGQNCEKTSSNKYYGYAGAFKCLAEGAGEVAFVKHVTVGQEVAKNPNYGNMSNYVYLCPDNTTKVVTADSYKNCSLAQVPSHVVMTKKGADVELFQKVLVKASELCQGNLSATNCSGFKIFESTKDDSDLLFKDSTKNLVAVGNKENTWQTWLTEKYMKTLKGLEDPCVEPSRAAFLAPGLTIALFLCGSLLMLFT